MSSSSRSTGKSPTQHVPAWKRLGLKLKPASEAQSHDDSSHHVTSTNTTSHLTGSNPSGKRRASGGPSTLDYSAKRARQDPSNSHQGPKKGKSVSFTAAGTNPSAAKTNQQKQKSTNKSTANTAPAKPTKKSVPVNLEPALTYLRTWHTSRENWKFNKNHQTKLLEHVFVDANETTIPAVDIDVFYEYIRGLQGGVRARLQELAKGIHAQDMEQGAAGFTATNAAGVAERRQKEYEEVIAKFLNQPRVTGKRLFAEVDYVLRTTDMEMQRRVVKRMRAEVVLHELGDNAESNTAASTSKGAEKNSANTSSDKGTADGATRLQLNDGPQQRTKRKRKVRTAAVEESSSESESDSEDESDADTSSSESSSSSSSSSSNNSSEEDSDEEGGEAASGSRGNDDSSSSSASSSESDSDSDSDSDDED